MPGLLGFRYFFILYFGCGVFSGELSETNEWTKPLNLADRVALLIYLIMKTLGDRVVPLDPLHPDASTPPARAVPSAPLSNIDRFTVHFHGRRSMFVVVACPYSRAAAQERR